MGAWRVSWRSSGGGERERDVPGVEADLVPLPLCPLLVLEIVDGVPAALGGEVCDKVVVGSRLGRLFDLDLLVVV